MLSVSLMYLTSEFGLFNLLFGGIFTGHFNIKVKNGLTNVRQLSRLSVCVVITSVAAQTGPLCDGVC